MINEKYEWHAISMNVLVEQIASIDRGLDYANPSNFAQVIKISNRPESMMIDLVRFLQMTRKLLRECKLDTESRMHMLRPTFFMTLRISWP